MPNGAVGIETNKKKENKRFKNSKTHQAGRVKAHRGRSTANQREKAHRGRTTKTKRRKAAHRGRSKQKGRTRIHI